MNRRLLSLVASLLTVVRAATAQRVAAGGDLGIERWASRGLSAAGFAFTARLGLQGIRSSGGILLNSWRYSLGDNSHDITVIGAWYERCFGPPTRLRPLLGLRAGGGFTDIITSGEPGGTWFVGPVVGANLRALRLTLSPVFRGADAAGTFSIALQAGILFPRP